MTTERREIAEHGRGGGGSLMHGPLAFALRADRSPPKGFWLVELALVALVLGLDFVTGPFIQLRIAYLLPVAVAAWHAGAAAGIAVALTLSLTRFAFVAAWDMPWPVEAAVINGLVSLAVLVAVVLFVQHVVYVRGLWKEVRILRGLVPICDSCGAVQGPDGHWSSLDALLMRHSEAKPVHGVCSRCCDDRAERSSGGTRSF